MKNENKIGDFKHDKPSHRSTLRVLRHGLEVSEMAVSDLPGNPNAGKSLKNCLNFSQSSS